MTKTIDERQNKTTKKISAFLYLEKNMSFKLMAQALDVKTGSSTTKLVLLKLCDNASDEGVCWPSQETIAEQCEISKRTVISSIKKLELLGLISSEKKYKNANKYQINLNSENISLVKDIHSNSANSAPLSSANSAPPYKEPISIEPIKESKNKQKDEQFEIFWSDYPRKVGKGGAKKAFDSALKKTSFEKIISGLLSHEIQVMKEIKYIPHASTWLNQERWSDEKESSAETKSIEGYWK